MNEEQASQLIEILRRLNATPGGHEVGAAIEALAQSLEASRAKSEALAAIERDRAEYTSLLTGRVSPRSKRPLYSAI